MKILVIDDHPLILDALAQLLPQLGNEIVVRGAIDAAAAIRILDDEPDVALVLLDLALPGMRGLDLLADLMLDYPGVPIVVLSATHDMRDRQRGALRRGPRIRSQDRGPGNPARRDPPRPGRWRVSTDRRHARCPTATACTSGRTSWGSRQRQTDVLRLLVEGKPNKVICRDLRLSEGTVKVHVSAILKALNVHSRTQADRRARAARHQRRYAVDARPTYAARHGDPARAHSRRAAASHGARADQVATLYALAPDDGCRWLLGAPHLCTRAVGPGVSPWRWRCGSAGDSREPGVARLLARAYRRAAPPVAEAPRWGRYWAIGSALAGALWGAAAIAMFPASPPHQALLIVCLFSVMLGGLHVTAVYTTCLLRLHAARRSCR